MLFDRVVGRDHGSGDLGGTGIVWVGEKLEVGRGVGDVCGWSRHAEFKLAARASLMSGKEMIVEKKDVETK